MEAEHASLEIFETPECKEKATPEEKAKLDAYYVERHSWSQLKKLLADTKMYHGTLMTKAPHDFTFVKCDDPEGLHSDRVYYLAMSSENRGNSLYYSEIPKTRNETAALQLSWKPLLDLFQIYDIFHIFPQTREDMIEFIFASVCKTGFRHLYKIATVLKDSRYKRLCGGFPMPNPGG